MANTIKLKRASGSDPGNSDLAAGELAIRTSNCKLFSKNDSGSAIGIVAGSADTLTTSRTIAGVSFDGSANISLNNNAITNGAGYITTVADTTIAPSEIDMEDNEKIKLGTGDDLEIYHDGSGSFISDTGTGSLAISGSIVNINNSDNSEFQIKAVENAQVELYHNGSKKFETESFGATLTGTLDVTNGDVKLQSDNNKIIFGAGSDLQIFHDGSHNYIQAHNGDLILQAPNQENSVKCVANGTVELYHDNTKRFESTSSGVTVTGALTTTGNINVPTGNGIVTGSVTTTSSTAFTAVDNGVAYFGTGNDLRIYHDGSHSFIHEAGTGKLLIRTSQLQLEDDANEPFMYGIKDAEVQLFYDGSKKFETASGGVSLTGGAAANITALSDGSTITIDMATASHHSVTLGGNRTFAAPSNQAVGQSGSIFITQDGTGSRTASFNSAFKFVGGTAPTLSTAASAVDRIDYVIKSSNVIHCAVSLDVK